MHTREIIAEAKEVQQESLQSTARSKRIVEETIGVIFIPFSKKKIKKKTTTLISINHKIFKDWN